MNLLDAVVTEVLSEPYLSKYGDDGWFINVEYNCWGDKSEGVLYFKTKEEAESITKGYTFLT